MRRSTLQIAIERVERAEHAAHQADGIAPFARPAAVRGPAFGFNLDPLEALVRDRDGEIGRFGHHGAISPPPGDQRVGADAGVLFINDAGDHQAAGVEAAGFGDHPRGADHRRHAALHVLRSAAVDAAIALDWIERPRHARDADGIDVAAVTSTSGRAPCLRACRPRSAVLGRPPESRPSVRSREVRQRARGQPQPRPRPLARATG